MAEHPGKSIEHLHGPIVLLARHVHGHLGQLEQVYRLCDFLFGPQLSLSLVRSLQEPLSSSAS